MGNKHGRARSKSAVARVAHEYTPAAYTPDWKALLDVLEEKIEGTSGQDQDISPLFFALDCVVDEIKSGEPIEDVPRVLTLFHKLFVYNNWHLVQHMLFSLPYVFRHAAEGVLEQLADNMLTDMLAKVANPKREVRDAVAQALGALAEVAGGELVARVVPHVRERLAQAAAQGSEATAAEAAEGYMMALGYVGGMGSGISAAHFAAVRDLLLDGSAHDDVPAFSHYVRLNAYKGLARMVRSPHCAVHFAATDFAAAVATAVSRGVADANIDVRKCAAALSLDWCLRVHGDREALQAFVASLLAMVGSTDSAHCRHGIGFALSLLCKEGAVVSQWDAATVTSVGDVLAAQVRVDTSRVAKELLIVASSASAVSGVALTRLYLCLLALRGGGGDASLAESMGALSLEQGTDLPALFASAVYPNIVALLQSPDPSLLDAGGACVQLLLGVIGDTELDELLCHAYKNKFHASLPIRDAVIKMWNHITSVRRISNEKLVASLSPRLITVLCEQAVSANGEVRESAFKAVESVCAHALVCANPHVSSAESAATLVAMLVKGTTDKRGGIAFEEPARAAAATALSALLRVPLDATPAQREGMLALGALLGLLSDESDLVAVGALLCVQSLAVSWRGVFGDALIDTFGAAVVAHSFSALENVRYVAVQVRATLLGSTAGTFGAHAGRVLKGMLAGPFSLLPEQADEETVREGTAKALRLVASHCAGDCGDDVTASLVRVALAGVLLEDNRDNAVIHAACIGALAKVFTARRLASADDALKVLLGKLLKFTVAAGRAEDIEVDFECEEECFEEDAEEEEEEEEEDDEDEEDDVECGVFSRYRLALLGRVGLHVCDVVGGAAAATFVTKLGALVSGDAQVAAVVRANTQLESAQLKAAVEAWAVAEAGETAEAPAVAASTCVDVASTLACVEATSGAVDLDGVVLLQSFDNEDLEDEHVPIYWAWCKEALGAMAPMHALATQAEAMAAQCAAAGVSLADVLSGVLANDALSPTAKAQHIVVVLAMAKAEHTPLAAGVAGELLHVCTAALVAPDAAWSPVEAANKLSYYPLIGSLLGTAAHVWATSEAASPEGASAWLGALAALGKSEWMRRMDSGRGVVGVLVAWAWLCASVGDVAGSGDVQQALADVLADDSIGEYRAPLGAALDALLHGPLGAQLHPLALPEPTPPNEAFNETFSTVQS